MSKGQTLQDPFLNALRKERIPVSIFISTQSPLWCQRVTHARYCQAAQFLSAALVLALSSHH